jgi:hypothetical protein
MMRGFPGAMELKEQIAAQRRIALAVELESFRNWHAAKGTTMKDWLSLPQSRKRLRIAFSA